MNDDLSRLIAASRGPFPGNVVLIARALLGRPYCETPLGDGGGVAPGERIRTDCFDCVTFVETCLAIAIALTEEEVLPTLDRVRYRRGQIGFATRNHFFGAEWLPHNAWLLEEGSPASGTPTRVYHRKTVDREAFLRSRGFDGPIEGPARIEVALPYLSREVWLKCPPRVPGVAVTAVVKERPHVEVIHAGLLVGSPPSMIHASSEFGKVVEERARDYLERHPDALGLTLWRVRPEARPQDEEPGEG